MTSSDTKVCKDCGVEKGLQEFPRNKGMKDGRRNSCKICRREYQKQWRQENKEYDKQYYQENKEYSKQWYQENKEYKLKYNKQWRQENREYRLKYSKQWYQENKEYYKQYCQDNRERRAAAGKKREALKIQAVPEHLMDCPVEKKRLEAIYKLRQVMSVATGEEYHVDHMWPLSKGGPHWSGNLQVIPAKDNLEKSASLCENTKRVIEQSLMESTHEV